MTGFATISRLERLRDFREAEQFYNYVKPIRGRAEDIRPLGARRDADKYRIVKSTKPDGEVEYQAVLYNTACVRYLQSGEIIVATEGYNTALTMQFIGMVLGIGAHRQRGSNVFRVSGENYITKGKDEMVIKHIGGNQYEIIGKNKYFHYLINRTGANNVRKRSAAFRGYLKGFISLRTQEVTRYGNTYDMVVVPTNEMAAAFGERTTTDWSGKKIKGVDVTMFQDLTNKRGATHAKFMESSMYLDKLITSDNVEDYYPAALMLVGRASTGGIFRKEPFTALPKHIVEILDESQFKLHAKEVFTLVEVAKNKVPNTKYDSWVDPTPSDSEYDIANNTLVIKG